MFLFPRRVFSFSWLVSLKIREKDKDEDDKPEITPSYHFHASTRHDSPGFSLVDGPVYGLEGWSCGWGPPRGYMLAFGMWIIGAPCVGRFE